MAGHSQFKNIMHRKGAQDRKRAIVFTKLAREITAAAKQYGRDSYVATAAITRARDHNVPKDVINRALERASSMNASDQLSQVCYEGFASGGEAIIVEALTDNPTRTVANVKAIFNKNGGKFAESGSVKFMFNYYGLILVLLNPSIDIFEFIALEDGVIEINVDEDDQTAQITTEPDKIFAIMQKLQTSYKIEEWKRAYVPMNYEISPDPESLANFLEKLDDNDDVQNIYTNIE